MLAQYIIIFIVFIYKLSDNYQIMLLLLLLLLVGVVGPQLISPEEDQHTCVATESVPTNRILTESFVTVTNRHSVLEDRRESGCVKSTTKPKLYALTRDVRKWRIPSCTFCLEDGPNQKKTSPKNHWLYCTDDPWVNYSTPNWDQSLGRIPMPRRIQWVSRLSHY